MASLIALGGHLDLTSVLDDWSRPIHDICLQLVPKESSWKALYSAIVCGSQEIAPEVHSLFRRTGLLHLLVVSGSHLAFLAIVVERAFNGLPGYRALGTVVLLFYALATKAQPPIVRALIQYGVDRTQEHFEWSWPKSWVIFGSGLVTLGLFDSWIHSWSFLLSWMASLAYPSLWLTYLLMFFPLMQFSPLHPLTVLMNLFLAPVMGLILFPISILAMLIPPFVPLVDCVWSSMIWILQQAQTLLPEGTPMQQGTLWLWFMILICQMIFYFLGTKWPR